MHWLDEVCGNDAINMSNYYFKFLFHVFTFFLSVEHFRFEFGDCFLVVVKSPRFVKSQRFATEDLENLKQNLVVVGVAAVDFEE